MKVRLLVSLFVYAMLGACGGDPPTKPTPGSGIKGEGDATPPDVFTEGVSLPAGHEQCPLGGTEIVKFRDKDNNERLTEADEVLDRQYECFLNPQDGSTSGGNTGGSTGGNTGGNKPTPGRKPVAFSLGASTGASSLVSISLVAAASAGESITNFSIASQPQRGTASISGTNVNYAPQNGFSGVDSFSYTATDSKGEVSTAAKVTVVVAGTAALFVNNEINAAQDTIVKNMLESMGFQVRVVDDDNASADQTNGAQIVLISESAQSVKIGTKLNDVAVPIIIWDAIVARSMNLIGQGTIDHVADQTKMDVLASAQQAANGLNGNITFTTNNAPFYYFTPAAHTLKITSINGDTNKPTLYVYEKGMTDLTGKTLPAARIGFPFLDLSLLTEDGKRLFQGTIRQSIAEP